MNIFETNSIEENSKERSIEANKSSSINESFYSKYRSNHIEIEESDLAKMMNVNEKIEKMRQKQSDLSVMQNYSVNSKKEDNLSSKIKLIRLYENNNHNESNQLNNIKEINEINFFNEKSSFKTKNGNNLGKLSSSPKIQYKNTNKINVNKSNNFSNKEYKGKDPLIKNLPKGLRIYELNEKLV